MSNAQSSHLPLPPYPLAPSPTTITEWLSALRLDQPSLLSDVSTQSVKEVDERLNQLWQEGPRWW